VIPLIAIGPPPSWEACDSALGRLAAFDAAAFTSVNAVEAFFDRARSLGVRREDLEALPAAAVGAATAAALGERGIRVTLVPAEFSASSLGLALGGSMAGKRVLLPCGTISRETLAGTLREAGAAVERVVVYATVASADADRSRVARGVLAGGFDVVTLASPSAAHCFAGAFTPAERARVHSRCRLAAIGGTTAEALRSLGLPADIIAGESTGRGLVDSITDYYARQ